MHTFCSNQPLLLACLLPLPFFATCNYWIVVSGLGILQYIVVAFGLVALVAMMPALLALFALLSLLQANVAITRSIIFNGEASFRGGLLQRRRSLAEEASF